MTTLHWHSASVKLFLKLLDMKPYIRGLMQLQWLMSAMHIIHNLQPVEVGQEVEDSLSVFGAVEHLDVDDVIGLQDLEDEYWCPAQDKDSHHHYQHGDNLQCYQGVSPCSSIYRSIIGLWTTWHKN